MASRPCYYPNGKVKTTYSPCDPGSDPQHAACCALDSSVCTENGYCVGASNLIYRGGCTDKSWKSGSCPQACSNQAQVDISTYTNIVSCDNGTTGNGNPHWCCANSGGSSCCANSFFILFGRPYSPKNVALDTSRTSSAASLTATSTTVISGTAASIISSSSSKEGLSTGSTLGIGVGVGLGVCALVIAAMAWFLCKERRKRLVTEKKVETLLAGKCQSAWIKESSANSAPRNYPAETYKKPHESNSTSVYEVHG